MGALAGSGGGGGNGIMKRRRRAQEGVDAILDLGPPERGGESDRDGDDDEDDNVDPFGEYR